MLQMCRLNYRHIVFGHVKSFRPILNTISKRSFFSEKELGVDDLRQNRLKVRGRIEKQNEDVNLHKMNLIESFPNRSIKEKTDQLYEYMLLTDSARDDLNMLKSLLVQYQNDIVAVAPSTDDVHNWTELHVGASIMRMFYLLNFPDAAIEFYKDERMQPLFDEMNAFKVLLTLLHNNKRYADIFKLYNEIRKQLEHRNQLPHASITVLAFSACYHLNTQEHYKYAKDLYPHVYSRHINAFKRRTKYLLAGLALKQNDPMFALQLLDPKEYQIGARFIRLIAFTQCLSFTDAFAVLYQTINTYKQGKMVTVPYFGTQVLADLRDAIVESGTNEQLIEFDKIFEELKSFKLLNEKTLDELLNAKFPTKYVKTKAELYFSERHNENGTTVIL